MKENTENILEDLENILFSKKELTKLQFLELLEEYIKERLKEMGIKKEHMMTFENLSEKDIRFIDNNQRFQICWDIRLHTWVITDFKTNVIRQFYDAVAVEEFFPELTKEQIELMQHYERQFCLEV